MLPVTELVRLLWALAVLEEYASPLFRNLAFRASRLPDGAPKGAQAVRLLRQVRPQGAGAAGG